MSKVSIELDTKSDELIVKVDGKELNNVENIHIYHYKYRDYDSDEDKDLTSIEICMCEKPSDKDDLRQYVRLSAAVNEDFSKPVEDVQRVQSDIERYLNIGNK